MHGERESKQTMKAQMDMKYVVIAILSVISVVILSLVIADYRMSGMEKDTAQKLTTLENRYQKVLDEKDKKILDISDYNTILYDANLGLAKQLNTTPKVENKVDIDALNSAIQSTVDMMAQVNQTKDELVCLGKTYAVKIQGKWYCIRRSSGGGSGSSSSVS